MHIGAPCCGMNAAVRYAHGSPSRAGMSLWLSSVSHSLISDLLLATASTLATTLSESTTELTGS